MLIVIFVLWSLFCFFCFLGLTLVLASVFGLVLLLGACVYFQPRILMRSLASYYQEPLWFIETKSKVCSLTIDDAPSASTEAILDLLKQYQVQATFFIIEENAKGREHLIQRMVDEGHVLGNHTTTDYPSIKYSPQELEYHLMKCDKLLKKYQPTKTKWFRPGSGWFNKRMIEIAKSHAYRLCLGSCYPHDAQIKSVTLNDWFLRARLKPGDIAIVHDRPWSVPVLQQALPVLTQHFRFVSLAELVDMDKKKHN